ncbi:MAG: serine/threonine-protein kinase, partial [Gemmatimonadaceae bacterium]
MTSPPAPDSLDAFRAELAERYDIEGEIGAGGMAVVYRARDLQRGRFVALKVLRAELGGGDSGDRFHREIRLVAQLVHPNILPLLDSGKTAGQLWYTMPFIDGESLGARLDREKQLPIDDAIRLTREIAEALSYAHAKGILHRDIKPDNILLADGHALVADFGIARALTDDPRGRITASGMALGTPGYMSPEQSTADRDVDARSDIYALGSVCYEMLAGEPPFTGPTAQAVIARRLTLPPPSLRTTRPTIPPSIDAAVQRALAPAPADRFATTLDFARALATGANASSQRGTPKERRLWMAAIALLAVAAIAGRTYRNSKHADVPAAARQTAAGGIRLAVVPFRLIGGDSTDRYLADGLSEEINSALSNLSGLRVIAQSSVVPVAASDKRPRDIAATLNAAA